MWSNVFQSLISLELGKEWKKQTLRTWKFRNSPPKFDFLKLFASLKIQKAKIGEITLYGIVSKNLPPKCQASVSLWDEKKTLRTPQGDKGIKYRNYRLGTPLRYKNCHTEFRVGSSGKFCCANINQWVSESVEVRF